MSFEVGDEIINTDWITDETHTRIIVQIKDHMYYTIWKDGTLTPQILHPLNLSTLIGKFRLTEDFKRRQFNKEMRELIEEAI